MARNPPGFAFVEYEDPRDAHDACKHLDGEKIGSGRVKVEMSRGGRGGRRSVCVCVGAHALVHVCARVSVCMCPSA